ncbi:MAG: hypothetical protein QXI16_07695 [Sulfolobaceae archaeon]
MKNEEKKRIKTYRNDYVYSEYTEWKPIIKDKSKLEIYKATTRKLNPETEAYEYETKELNYRLMWESEKQLLDNGNFNNKEIIKA